MNTNSLALVAAFVLAVSPPVWADDTGAHASHHPAATTNQAQPATPQGSPAEGGNMNCPMMNGQHAGMGDSTAPSGESSGAPPRQHMGGGGRMVAMPHNDPHVSPEGNGMTCPMMQGGSGN